MFLSVRLVQPLRRRHVSSRRASLDHVGNFLNNSEKRNKLWARLVEKLRQSHYSSLNKIQVSQTLDGLFVCFLNILRSDLNASLLVFFSIHPNEKKNKNKTEQKNSRCSFSSEFIINKWIRCTCSLCSLPPMRRQKGKIELEIDPSECISVLQKKQKSKIYIYIYSYISKRKILASQSGAAVRLVNKLSLQPISCGVHLAQITHKASCSQKSFFAGRLWRDVQGPTFRLVCPLHPPTLDEAGFE